ncbi:ankyrin repeat domain-containing protein [Exiguobacterium sp. Helios]|uniref:ankyrin repeat domain-containing protein n=1 Tax=Exiguobacterium sp. Helios TaxID=2735868 RepID=UPI00165D402C|nr:ankyrin repeat domain-containing protein [Exiguobacterium sp. Helios]QNR21711.1 ankyrin repeat domain-containing protein [Exiguobacterium sp. Helios]
MTRKKIMLVVLLFLVGIGGTTYLLIDYRNQQTFEESLKVSDATKLQQAVATVDLSTKERNRYIRKFQETLEYEKALVLLDRTSAKNQQNWFYVAQFAPTDIVKQWLAAGASMKQVNKNKQNVLHVATSINRSVDAYDLLVKQASKSQLNQLDRFGHTPLYYATVDQNQEAMELLLAAGAVPDKGTDPPIYETVKQNRTDLYQLLKTSGASANTKQVKKIANNYGAESFK